MQDDEFRLYVRKSKNVSFLIFLFHRVLGQYLTDPVWLVLVNGHLSARSGGRHWPRHGQTLVRRTAAVGCRHFLRFGCCWLQFHEPRARAQHALPLRIYFRPPSGNGPDDKRKRGE